MSPGVLALYPYECLPHVRVVLKLTSLSTRDDCVLPNSVVTVQSYSTGPSVISPSFLEHFLQMEGNLVCPSLWQSMYQETPQAWAKWEGWSLYLWGHFFLLLWCGAPGFSPKTSSLLHLLSCPDNLIHSHGFISFFFNYKFLSIASNLCGNVDFSNYTSTSPRGDLIGLSNITNSKLTQFSCQSAFPTSSKWQFHSPSCPVQKLWSQGWILSFSYTLHIIHQKILSSLLLTCIQNPTTSPLLDCHHPLPKHYYFLELLWQLATCPPHPILHTVTRVILIRRTYMQSL